MSDKSTVLAALTLDGDRPGLGLVIGGVAVNEDVGDIWTLQDLRQLRDDLTALLADERFTGALREQEEHPRA